jgi:hypothetical protein
MTKQNMTIQTHSNQNQLTPHSETSKHKHKNNSKTVKIVRDCVQQMEA